MRFLRRPFHQSFYPARAPTAEPARRRLPLAGPSREVDRQWKPVYAVWEVTLACDLSCRHCGSRAGRARPDELTTAEALDLVAQMADLGVMELTLIGGEAYLRDDFLDMGAGTAKAVGLVNPLLGAIVRERGRTGCGRSRPRRGGRRGSTAGSGGSPPSADLTPHDLPHLLSTMLPRPSSHACPRCALPLVARRAATAGPDGPVVVESCGACRGLWLDTASASRVAEALPTGVPSLAEEAARHAVAQPAREAAAPCPVCSRTMVKTTVAEARIELDTCPEHGTWYDKSELQQVAAALGAHATTRVGGAADAAPPEPPAEHAKGAPPPASPGTVQAKAEREGGADWGLDWLAEDGLKYAMNPQARFRPATTSFDLAADAVTALVKLLDD